MSERSKNRKIVTGRVTSTKMDKSAVVSIDRQIKHPVYHKYMVQKKKFMVHDEKNLCKEGDLVRIIACRPMSKNKTWRLLDVVEAAQGVSDDTDTISA